VHSIFDSCTNAETNDIRVIRALDDEFAFAYSTSGHSFTIDISQKFIIASWYNPRTGKTTPIGNFSGAVEFDPPGEPGVGNDWVLVLEKT